MGDVPSPGVVLVAGRDPAATAHPSQPRGDRTALSNGLSGYLQNSTGMWGEGHGAKASRAQLPGAGICSMALLNQGPGAAPSPPVDGITLDQPSW